jgi:hypothetical protein
LSFDFLCLFVVCSCLLLHYFHNKLFPGSRLAASLSKTSISCQLRTVAEFARICQIKVSLARHTLAAPTGFCHQRMNQKKTCRTCKNCKTQVPLPRLQLQQVRHLQLHQELSSETEPEEDLQHFQESQDSSDPYRISSSRHTAGTRLITRE